MKNLNDRVSLIIVALVSSICAWAFWHYAGENAFSIFSSLLIILLFADNIKLRKRVKQLSKDEET